MPGLVLFQQGMVPLAKDEVEAELTEVGHNAVPIGAGVGPVARHGGLLTRGLERPAMIICLALQNT